MSLGADRPSGQWGLCPGQGYHLPFSPEPPLSRWEKQHGKQRWGMSFILLTPVTLTKRKKIGAITLHHFCSAKPFDIHRSLPGNKGSGGITLPELSANLRLKELQFQVSKEIQCNLICHTLWFQTKMNIVQMHLSGIRGLEWSLSQFIAKICHSYKWIQKEKRTKQNKTELSKKSKIVYFCANPHWSGVSSTLNSYQHRHKEKAR